MIRGLKYVLLPIGVTARPLLCTIFYRSTTGIVGSNSTRGTVYEFSVFGFCVDSCLRSPTRCLSTRFRNTINERPWTSLVCRAKEDECFRAIRGVRVCFGTVPQTRVFCTCNRFQLLWSFPAYLNFNGICHLLRISAFSCTPDYPAQVWNNCGCSSCVSAICRLRLHVILKYAVLCTYAYSLILL